MMEASLRQELLTAGYSEADLAEMEIGAEIAAAMMPELDPNRLTRAAVLASSLLAASQKNNPLAIAAAMDLLLPTPCR